ncbi:hypothetical protein PMIN06_004254 [Paraphaeosphaeria minitans]
MHYTPNCPLSPFSLYTLTFSLHSIAWDHLFFASIRSSICSLQRKDGVLKSFRQRSIVVLHNRALSTYQKLKFLTIRSLKFQSCVFEPRAVCPSVDFAEEAAKSRATVLT